MSELSGVVPALGELQPVRLDDVMASAALLRRVDRKYLVPVAVADGLLAALAGTHRVLEIDGRRSTSYRSTYLDLPGLRCCRDHLVGRSLRWKARSRLYVEDGLCRFEVKIRSGRGDTVKQSVDVPRDRYGRVGEEERALAHRLLGPTRGRESALLEPTLEITYERATLADLEAGVRVTVDHRVVSTPVLGGIFPSPAGIVALDPGWVILETKAGVRASAADRALVRLGHRPVSLSKYATTAALLTEELPTGGTRRGARSRFHLVADPRCSKREVA